MVEPYQVSKLFAIQAIMDTIGVLIGAPSIARIFSAGLVLPGVGRGLMYFVALGVFVVSAIPFFATSPDDLMDDGEDG
jgi:hypothetical protein